MSKLKKAGTAMIRHPAKSNKRSHHIVIIYASATNANVLPRMHE